MTASAEPRPDGATRLVLVRHGETDWNAAGRWQGQAGEGLNALGRAQARATAAHLAAAFGDAALLVRSDSQRVAETAEPLEALLDVPVLVDPRLREIDVGRWSGLTRPQVEALDPRGWAAYRRGDVVPIGGGESVADLEARMLAALADVVAAVGEGTAIVLTHGWALRVAVAGLLRLDAAEAAAMARVTNCSATVVDVRDGVPALVAYGGCAHLDAEGLRSAGRGAAARA